MKTKKNSVGMERAYDISVPPSNLINITINGAPCTAYDGELLLTALLAHGLKEISKNDHQQTAGAYCGMGICFCCTVVVDGHKRRACKTLVREGMAVNTTVNNQDLVEDYLTIQNN